MLTVPSSSDALPPATSSNTPGSVPRRTSSRLAQASSTPTNKIRSSAPVPDTDDDTDGSSPRPVSKDHHLLAVEIAIPRNKTRLSSRGSSAASVAEETSEDGPNDYSTPETSVAVTPAESSKNTSRKRISATARARELGSSTMSLNSTQRGRKRSFGGISTEAPTTEDSDANLARALQIREYQRPSAKRQRTSFIVKKRAFEVPDSTEDDEPLTELEDMSEFGDEETIGEWEPSGESSPAGIEEVGQDDLRRNDTAQSDSTSSSSDSDDEPLMWQSLRNRNRGNRRGRGRTSTRAPPSRSQPPGMSNRVSEKTTSVASTNPL